MDGRQPFAQIAEVAPIGRIVSISGAQVVMLLHGSGRDAGLAEGPPPQIGSLAKMRTADSTVFAMVSGLSIPIPASVPGESEAKIVELDLLGECVDDADATPGRFRRGVSIHPSLGDDVYPATPEDLSLVYAQPDVPNARIGTVHQDRRLPAFVGIDELLGKHFAILGATGCGKSCAVALILRSILEQRPNGHVLLLDLHNEYSHAFSGVAEILSSDVLEIPYWLLNYDEIQEIFIGRSGNRNPEEAVILGEVIVEAKRRFRGQSTSDGLTVDTPTPYRLSDVERILDEAAARLDDPNDTAVYLRLKIRLANLSADRRYGFMFPGISVRDNLVAILSRLFRVPVDGKPVTIVDLSDVPSEILNVVVSVLCRMTLDFGQWSDHSIPILLVCEEAHRYVPKNDRLGFQPTKGAISRIAKEGRKYGVSLCVVSQRPSELDNSVVSQCNTVFAMRLTNNQDQEFVGSALPDSAAGLVDALPTLRNAEAVVVGDGVAVPVRLCLSDLAPEHRPKSGTASFASAWVDDSEATGMIESIVARSRRQNR